MTKLAVSPAGWIGLAVGFADLVGQYRDRIKAYGATPFERAVSTLPHELRAARDAKIEHARDYGYAYHAKTAYALIGCSAGRIRAVVFYEHRDFAPVEADDVAFAPCRRRTGERGRDSRGGATPTAIRSARVSGRDGPDARRRALKPGWSRLVDARAAPGRQ